MKRKTKQKYPWYGAESVFTFVKLRGHVLPVTSSDDQYRVRFPDGTQLWVEKWECDSAFEHLNHVIQLPCKSELKARAMDRLRRGEHRNKASDPTEIDLAFERNEGKFED